MLPQAVAGVRRSAPRTLYWVERFASALPRARLWRMYHAIIQQYIRQLRNLSVLLDKAIDHAAARKFDPNNYLGLRLAPDMFPFIRQVQSATDVAKAAAGTFGNKDIPKYPDTESTMAELQGRVQKTIAYLESFFANDFAHNQDDAPIQIPFPAGARMAAKQALLERSMPNFYFHVVTSYDILRQAGVALGKADYLGKLQYI